VSYEILVIILSLITFMSSECASVSDLTRTNAVIRLATRSLPGRICTWPTRQLSLDLRVCSMVLNSDFVVPSGAFPAGGPTTTGDAVGARNWPDRGGKHSLWRGGELITGFVWASENLMPARGPRTYENMMHAVDWLPTLAYGLVGIDPNTSGTLPLDGVDQWSFIAGTNSTKQAPREQFLGNIDRDHQGGGHWAVQNGCYKLL